MESFHPIYHVGYSITLVLVILLIIVIFAVILLQTGRVTVEWKHNNHSPVLTVPAKVVAKRSKVLRYVRRKGSKSVKQAVPFTVYYVTFRMESGGCVELHLPVHEYGLLCEGEEGSLTFQGSRYKSFHQVKA